jgi:hypothetical protein
MADRSEEVEAKLREVLEPLSVPFIDSDAAYVDDYDSYWVASHWNEKGQRSAAEVLAPKLRRHLLSDLAATD